MKDPAFVERTAMGELRPTCDKCHWEGPVVQNVVIANELLRRHRDSRLHKSNTAANHRFTV